MTNDSYGRDQDLLDLASELVEASDKLVPLEMQRSGDVGKWGLAALLTINGGGLLGVLNAGSRFDSAFAPALFFGGGMLCALASAVSIRADVRRDIDKARSLIRQAKRVLEGSSNAPRTTMELRSLWSRNMADHVFRVLPAGFEVLSVGAFIVGAALALVLIDPGQRANADRCRVLQADMLRAQPLRPDSRELFAVLGCRPQGTGKVYARPTAREEKAGHPLPYGGYPPPR
jgi:hypothetical protein